MNEILYDPVTGEFSWAISRPGALAGARAGSMTGEGYWQVKVRRRVYRAHRLAWFLFHGEWPVGEIDHINGDRLDNRIENLRVVDRSGNAQNIRAAHRDHNSCGMQGVTWNKHHRKWQAKIMANKVRYHLGYFQDPAIAHSVYLSAKARLHIDGGCH